MVIIELYPFIMESVLFIPWWYLIPSLASCRRHLCASRIAFQDRDFALFISPSTPLLTHTTQLTRTLKSR